MISGNIWLCTSIGAIMNAPYPRTKGLIMGDGALIIFLILGIVVFLFVAIILRALWMWLLGINEVLTELRAIRAALESRAESSAPAAPPVTQQPVAPTQPARYFGKN